MILLLEFVQNKINFFILITFSIIYIYIYLKEK